MRQKWTDELVAERVMEIAARLGRMPSSSEMKASGPLGVALSSQVSRRGGFETWRKRLGLKAKEHDSRKGWKWEKWFVDQCVERGMVVQARDRVKAPFDALVNGHKVDVKCSRYAEYGVTNHQRGWIFRLSNLELPDFWAVISLRGDEPVSVHIIPSREAPSTMLTIQASGRGKYECYRGAWHLLA